MYNVYDIANKLLVMAEDKGELMTNLKLQKMLYYQQGFHLAYFNEPLFQDEIEAWMYGPVVPAIYYKYDNFDKNGIPGERNQVLCLTGTNEEALFEEVFRVYGSYSAIGLMEMTHKETPWKSVPVRKGSIIPMKTLQTFFKKRLR